MELLPLPRIGRVVVTLGALDLDPHEDPRDLARHLDRLALVRGRIALRCGKGNAAAGGNERHRETENEMSPVKCHGRSEPATLKNGLRNP